MKQALHEQAVTKLKSSPRAALEELKAMGVPVVERNDEGYFVISGESNDGDVIWADYHQEYKISYLDDFGVHKDIVKVLAKHRLYAEWANPGYLNDHDL